MNWKFERNIKQYLTEGKSKEAMQAAYDGIAKELDGLPLPRPEMFHHYAKLGIEQEDINIFNTLGLNSLYDWADEYRVWLGMK